MNAFRRLVQHFFLARPRLRQTNSASRNVSETRHSDYRVCRAYSFKTLFLLYVVISHVLCISAIRFNNKRDRLTAHRLVRYENNVNSLFTTTRTNGYKLARGNRLYLPLRHNDKYVLKVTPRNVFFFFYIRY